MTLENFVVSTIAYPESLDVLINLARGCDAVLF